MLAVFIRKMQFLHLFLQCESALLSAFEKWLPKLNNLDQRRLDMHHH